MIGLQQLIAALERAVPGLTPCTEGLLARWGTPAGCLPGMLVPYGTRVRVAVLIVIVVAIVALRALGLDLPAAIATLTAAGVIAAEISERMLGRRRR